MVQYGVLCIQLLPVWECHCPKTRPSPTKLGATGNGAFSTHMAIMKSLVEGTSGVLKVLYIDLCAAMGMVTYLVVPWGLLWKVLNILG